MRPFVNAVKFNIQGGGEYHLGPKTLIVGANTTGKSSIVRAIELATTGRASDVAGRDTLALDAELWTLAGDGVEVAAVSALFNDGQTTAAWTLQRGKKAKRVGKTATFPLRSVRDAILGSAETARKFFLSVAGSTSWDDVLAEIPPAFHEKMKPYRTAGDGAAALLTALDAIKRRVREVKAEAKAQRSLAESLSRGLPPPPSADDVARAKAASENTIRVSQMTSARARLLQVEEEIRAGEALLHAVSITLQTAIAEHDKLPPPLPPIVAHAIAVGEYLSVRGDGECAICGKIASGKTFKFRVENAKSRVAESMKIDELRSTLERTRSKAQTEEAATSGVLGMLRSERAYLQKIIGESIPGVVADVVDYGTIIATATKWETIRESEGRAVQFEADAAQIETLTTLCQTAMERLIEKRRQSFEARVQKFLPPAFSFGVELKDGDRDVMRIGLRQGVALRTALSGAEWSAVTAALAAAVVDANPMISKDSPVIIVPEDRDFDSKTLMEVMQAFSPIDGQVIITATKLPFRPVDGWTVIDLDLDSTKGDVFAP